MKWVQSFVLLLLVTSASAQRTAVQVDYKSGFNHETDSILQVALHLLDSIVNTDSFAARMNSATFKRNNGLSNKEILDRYRSGNENGVADNIINLRLDVYPGYAGGGEVGHTTGDNVTHTYQEYITRNGAACYAAHLAHEYAHVLGFSHPRFRFLGNTKALSVPYVIGDIVAGLLGAKCL